MSEIPEQPSELEESERARNPHSQPVSIENSNRFFQGNSVESGQNIREELKENNPASKSEQPSLMNALSELVISSNESLSVDQPSVRSADPEKNLNLDDIERYLHSDDEEKQVEGCSEHQQR